jgi:hypothetical protein
MWNHEKFLLWTVQGRGKTYWFDYRDGGWVFIFGYDYDLVCVVEQGVIFDVLGSEVYHRVKGSRELLVGITL